MATNDMFVTVPPMTIVWSDGRVSLTQDGQQSQPDELFSCDSTYGTNLVYEDCLTAARQLPVNDEEVALVGRNRLPIQRHSGQCYVTIEGSGSSPDPQARAILSDLQTMAFKLVERCVKGNNGSGGYGVSGFQAFLDWVLHDPNPQIPPWHAPPPVSASFLTVTISDASYRRPSPGNNNPSIALTVYQSLRKLHHDFPDVDTQYPNVLKKADYWWRLSQTIPEDGRTPWWTIQMPETQQETTYECDASLGSPADCSEVEWNLLGPGGAQSDTVTVGSGAVTFLHSNTCYLAISAFTSLVLTWEQIRAAATTLISVCTQNPWQAPQGGRAYGGPQPQRTSGRSRERKTRVPSVNSLNALPRGVNVTIFKQQEPWINQAAELKSCAWKAVLKQTPTSPCGPA